VKPPKNPMPYMDESWFAMLVTECDRTGNVAAVALRLAVSAPLLYQVLSGTGEYGKGKASTARLADKVLHQLGNYTCPHLSEQYEEVRVISSDECRRYAHRPPPTGSPRDLKHWQACRRCVHFGASAPPQPRQPITRRRGEAAEGDTTTATPTDEGKQP
jgi:hypothetical protein